VPEAAEASRQVVEQVRRECAAAGFDLVQPLQVGWYNSQVSGSLRLEDYGSPAHLALVIGNTRALWEPFLQALRSDPALLSTAHPLYTYTERCITRAASGLARPWCLRWSHSGGERLVAMQRLAHAAGLAYLSESQLSVHAEYGPWIGLRAALSIDLPGPSGPPPQLPHPCAGCSGRCRPALERAIAAVTGTVDDAAVEQHWQLWLACRDACPTGRQYRYTDEQILYHYKKDRNQLREACRARPTTS
jgi:hypothetical protein